jgi:hypothetical protein
MCGEKKYEQEDIEAIMDDYGGNVILVHNDSNSQEKIEFTECNNHTFSIGYRTVTMVSNDKSKSILLVLVFNLDNSPRKLISGQLIKNGNIFRVMEFDVYQNINPSDDTIASGICIYTTI